MLSAKADSQPADPLESVGTNIALVIIMEHTVVVLSGNKTRVNTSHTRVNKINGVGHIVA